MLRLYAGPSDDFYLSIFYNHRMTDTTPPKLSLSLSEISRSGLEAGNLVWTIRNLIKQAPQGDGHPILALPGYGGGDGSMATLRFFLKRIGYTPYALDLGRNYEPPEERIMRIEDAIAFREKMAGQVAERVEEIHQQTSEPVTLIGWSMGGLYAVDVSQQLPDITRQVITLGSPFGDPRGTAAFQVLRKFNRSTVPLEEQNFDAWINKRQIKSKDIPIKVIYSKKDGIVGLGTAQLDEHPSVEHIEVPSSHIGFAINPKVLSMVATLLTTQE